MFDWNSLWSMLQAAGLPGLVIGVAILIFVYIGQFTNIFPNGTFKRLAVLIGSALFSNLQSGQVMAAITTALAVVVSTAGKLLIDAIVEYLKTHTPAQPTK